VARIIPIETPTLGDRSYLVHDGEVAFVIDPQRPVIILTVLAVVGSLLGTRLTSRTPAHTLVSRSPCC
jgi:hypothetical protein